MSSSKASMHRRKSSAGKDKPPALTTSSSQGSGSGIQIEHLHEEEEDEHRHRHDHSDPHEHPHHSHDHSTHARSLSHSPHHANEQDALDALGPSPRSPSLALPPTTPTHGYFLASPKPPGSPYIPLYSPQPPPLARSDSHFPPEEEVGNSSESLDDLPPLPQSTPSKGSSTFASSSSSSAAEKKRHERIHSRNLSVFFPRPGQGGGDEERGGGVGEEEAPVSEIGYAGRIGGAQQGRSNGGFMFGESTEPGVLTGPSRANGAAGELEGVGGAKVSGRRGHHHKHSLSHNFFSFMDPGQTNPALSSSQTDPFLSSHNDGPWSPTSPFSPSMSDPSFPTSSDFPQSVQNDGSRSSQLPPLLSSRPATFLGSLAVSSDYVKAMVLFGVLEFALGASLWVDGQAGGSVSVTGLGYLVVFDALGVLGMVVGKVMENSRGVASSYRFPFGNHRMESLILFAQAIFLLFSSVYICKESIEHVLLLGHDHDDDFFEMILPTTLLAVAFAASLFSALVFKNHSKLVESVGAEIMGPDRLSGRYRSYLTSSVLVRVFSLINNPFSLVVLACTGALLFGGILLDQDAFSNLDKLVAILETVLTFKISYPASVAFGRVLLQTAPPERAVQMINLTKSLREVESHPMVVYLAPPHVWRILHHQASTVLPPPSKSLQPDFGGRGVRPQSPSSLLNATNAAQASSSCLLVVTLIVHVRQDASDQNLLDITKFVYDRCAGAVGVSRRGRGGYTGDNGGEGELTVEVKRGAPSFSMDS